MFLVIIFVFKCPNLAVKIVGNLVFVPQSLKSDTLNPRVETAALVRAHGTLQI